MQRFSSLLPDRRLLTGVAIGALVSVLGVGAVSAGPVPATSTTGTAPMAQLAAAAPAVVPAASLRPVKPGFRLEALRNILRRNWRVDVTATGENGVHSGSLLRGTLTLGTGSVTVTLPDDSTQVFAVDASTIVRSNGRTVAFSTLKTGDHVLVLGSKNDDGSLTARVIRLQPADPTPAP